MAQGRLDEDLPRVVVKGHEPILPGEIAGETGADRLGREGLDLGADDGQPWIALYHLKLPREPAGQGAVIDGDQRELDAPLVEDALCGLGQSGYRIPVRQKHGHGQPSPHGAQCAVSFDILKALS
jgi:hypothetical protein